MLPTRARAATLCAADQKVVSNACTDCPSGKTNAAGDSCAGDDTTCDAAVLPEDGTETPLEPVEDSGAAGLRVDSWPLLMVVLLVAAHLALLGVLEVALGDR